MSSILDVIMRGITLGLFCFAAMFGVCGIVFVFMFIIQTIHNIVWSVKHRKRGD